MSDPYATVMRPLKLLKAFEKILIEKKHTVTVNFEIGEKELGFYKPDGSFTVEKGDFYIYIGKDCYDDNWIKLQVV